MSWLIVVSGKSRGEMVPIKPPRIVVGRDESCHLQVKDELVSRRHLEVHCQDDNPTCRLVDLKSANGTFLAGQRVNEVVLRDGDVLSIGDSRLLFTDRQFADGETALNFFKVRGERGRSTIVKRAEPDASGGGDEPERATKGDCGRRPRLARWPACGNRCLMTRTKLWC